MPGQFSGLRGLVQSYLPALIREGFTNSQIVDFLRLNDFGYRVQNMFADINRIRLEQFGAEGIKKLNIFQPIPENLMRTWEGETKFNYRVVVQYQYTSAVNGELLERATTLYYNEPPSVNDVLEDFGVRTQTIEGGFGTPQDVERVGDVIEINYFKNRPKAG